MSKTPQTHTVPVGIVQVCPECDIAGCKHLRAALQSAAEAPPPQPNMRVPKGWKLVPEDPSDSGSTMGDAYLAGYEDGLDEAALAATATEGSTDAN